MTPLIFLNKLLILEQFYIYRKIIEVVEFPYTTQPVLLLTSYVNMVHLLQLMN